MILVYTTIFGGSDSLKPAPVRADRCVCFVDREYEDSNGWELWTLRDRPAMNPRREAWHLRCTPHVLFPDATKTVWVDASFTVTNLPQLLKDSDKRAISAQRHARRKNAYEEGRELIECGQSSREDIDCQLRAYRQVGFPDVTLHVTSCLVRENSQKVTKFNETWDAEIQKHPGDNTQVSVDYSAWVNKLTIHDLQGNRHVNPYWTHDKSDHRKRRQPYRPEHVYVR